VCDWLNTYACFLLTPAGVSTTFTTHTRLCCPPTS